MRLFRWIAPSDIPRAWDLRRCGWTLADPGDDCAGVVALIDRRSLDEDEMFLPDGPALVCPRHGTIVIGAESSDERARLLRVGFGDALPADLDLDEIDARAAALCGRLLRTPIQRTVGTLHLDLVDREAYFGGKPLGVLPREFALLWRLAETPGVAVTKQVLLREVWHLQHVPETNSLAVHVSRLRHRLRSAGIGWMIATTPSGGYALVGRPDDAVRAVPLARDAFPRDTYLRHAEPAQPRIRATNDER